MSDARNRMGIRPGEDPNELWQRGVRAVDRSLIGDKIERLRGKRLRSKPVLSRVSVLDAE
jgi:hypothetical protein